MEDISRSDSYFSHVEKLGLNQWKRNLDNSIIRDKCRCVGLRFSTPSRCLTTIMIATKQRQYIQSMIVLALTRPIMVYNWRGLLIDISLSIDH